MSFDPSIMKIHPLIHRLREELQPDPLKLTNNNFWFCLRPDKKLEYIQKNKIYHDSTKEPEENKEFNGKIIQGYARKSGEIFRKAHNIHKALPDKTEKRKFFKNRRNFMKSSLIKGKKFIIQIDD